MKFRVLEAFGKVALLLGLALGSANPVHAQYVEYIHTDALGSPVAATDSNRIVVQHSEYEPYGKLLNRPALDEPGYTGHVADAATGLDYMQQRYYDPGVGRFLSTDPVSATIEGGGFNRFWYANNNPFRFTDPDGRAPCEVCDFLREEPHMFPKGDIVRAAGESFAALAAYGKGLATGDAALQQTAVEGMRENVSASDGINAAVMAVGPGEGERTFTTYTRTNVEGVVYSGRTSGIGTPEQQVAARTSSLDHQAKTAAGYGPGVVDRNSSNRAAIRGREQQLIDQHGGAQSQGGTSGNAINGVSQKNPKASDYQRACTREFGC